MRWPCRRRGRNESAVNANTGRHRQVRAPTVCLSVPQSIPTTNPVLKLKLQASRPQHYLWTPSSGQSTLVDLRRDDKPIMYSFACTVQNATVTICYTDISKSAHSTPTCVLLEISHLITMPSGCLTRCRDCNLRMWGVFWAWHDHVSRCYSNVASLTTCSARPIDFSTFTGSQDLGTIAMSCAFAPCRTSDVQI